MGGATQIGSKRTFPIKLKNGLTSSRVQTTFAVHARLIYAPTRPDFHAYGWATGPWELKTPGVGHPLRVGLDYVTEDQVAKRHCYNEECG
jgi:hypothetical protein